MQTRHVLVMSLALFCDAKHVFSGVERPPPPIRADLASSDFVVFVRPGLVKEGETDLLVLDVLKAHPILKDRKKFVLRQSLPRGNTIVMFGGVINGTIVTWRREISTDESMVHYIRALKKLDAKKPAEALRHAFDHLRDANKEIADDAFREFSDAPFEAHAEAARLFTAPKIWGILRDPKTPPHIAVLSAHFLGFCGTPQDADELRKLLDHKSFRGHYADGVYFSMVALNPQKYFPRVKAIASDRNAPFVKRLPILVATRKLHQTRPGEVTEKMVLELTEIFLESPDMADFAIEDLRAWKRWDYTDRILGRFGKKPFDNPIIRKATLRFALQAPGPAAAAFVEKRRMEDAEWVADMKELFEEELKLSPMK